MTQSKEFPSLPPHQITGWMTKEDANVIYIYRPPRCLANIFYIIQPDKCTDSDFSSQRINDRSSRSLGESTYIYSSLSLIYLLAAHPLLNCWRENWFAMKNYVPHARRDESLSQHTHSAAAAAAGGRVIVKSVCLLDDFANRDNRILLLNYRSQPSSSLSTGTPVTYDGIVIL